MSQCGTNPLTAAPSPPPLKLLFGSEESQGLHLRFVSVGAGGVPSKQSPPPSAKSTQPHQGGSILSPAPGLSLRRMSTGWSLWVDEGGATPNFSNTFFSLKSQVYV